MSNNAHSALNQLDTSDASARLMCRQGNVVNPKDSRVIEIQLGRVVSDTCKTSSLVGFKMDIASGFYHLVNGDWVLAN